MGLRVVFNNTERIPAEVEPFRRLVSFFDLLLDIVMTFDQDLLVDWIYKHGAVL